MTNSDQVINEALRSSLTAMDPALGNYALSQAAWKAVKRAFNK